MVVTPERTAEIQGDDKSLSVDATPDEYADPKH